MTLPKLVIKGEHPDSAEITLDGQRVPGLTRIVLEGQARELWKVTMEVIAEAVVDIEAEVFVLPVDGLMPPPDPCPTCAGWGHGDPPKGRSKKYPVCPDCKGTSRKLPA